MRWEVTFYVGGKLFKEIYFASNIKEARITATSRYPRAKIVGLNPTFL